jgi:hypothetical protein
VVIALAHVHTECGAVVDAILRTAFGHLVIHRLHNIAIKSDNRPYAQLWRQ